MSKKFDCTTGAKGSQSTQAYLQFYLLLSCTCYCHLVRIGSLELESSRTFPEPLVSCCGSEHSIPNKLLLFIVGSGRTNSAKLLIFLLILQTSLYIYFFCLPILTFFTSGGIEQFTKWENCMCVAPSLASVIILGTD